MKSLRGSRSALHSGPPAADHVFGRESLSHLCVICVGVAADAMVETVIGLLGSRNDSRRSRRSGLAKCETVITVIALLDFCAQDMRSCHRFCMYGLPNCETVVTFELRGSRIAKLSSLLDVWESGLTLIAFCSRLISSGCRLLRVTPDTSLDAGYILPAAN